MSCPYTEVLSESRAISATRTGTSQTIVIEFSLPTDETGDLMSPVFHLGASTFLGESDDVLALETAYSLIPLTRWLPSSTGEPLLLELESLDVTQVSNYDRWKAVAEYTFDSNRGRGAGGQDPDSTDPPGPSLPYMRWGFTVGGQTRNITTARSTPGKVTRVGGPALPAEDHIPIGMTKDGIAGADVPGGGLTLQLTGFFYPETIDLDYIDGLTDLLNPTSNMNDAPFLGRLAGEVLILGASGGGTLFDIVPITFDFSIKPNKLNEPDAPFPDLTCFGHDLLDYIYLEEIDAAAQTQIMKPTYRYIHYVHKLGDFTKLKLPITG